MCPFRRRNRALKLPVNAADSQAVKRAPTILLGALVLALAVRAGLSAPAGLDYFVDGGTAIDALARWDLQGFLINQPLMGSFSLLIRAPFVAPVFTQGETVVYMAGVIPCLLAAMAFGLSLMRVLAAVGTTRTVQVLAAGLVIINPVTFRAVYWGHPEEILGAVLCAGAVLAALRGRPIVAGVLLGLAVATKQWAVLAILPTLLAASDRRVLISILAASVAAVLTLPFLLLAPDQFGGVVAGVSGQTGLPGSTTPWNVWWPFAYLTDVGGSSGTRYLLPDSVAGIFHPLIIGLALPLSVALWRRPRRRPDDALLLLALLFLLRCLLDNWNNEYYHVPFVLSLLAWETLRFRTVPRLTMAVMAAIGLTFFPTLSQMYQGSMAHSPISNAVYLGWALPLCAGLGVTLYRPALLGRALGRTPAVAPPRTVLHSS